MSLPINPGAFDRSMLEQALEELKDTPELFNSLARSALLTELATTSARTNFNEYEKSLKAQGFHALMMQARELEAVRVSPEMLALDLELAREARDTLENVVTSALLGESTMEKPSRSFTAPSNLSGDSLLTSFLSITSSKSSGSKSTSSKSGLPKLLSSPSKGTQTKSSTPSFLKSSTNGRPSKP